MATKIIKGLGSDFLPPQGEMGGIICVKLRKMEEN